MTFCIPFSINKYGNKRQSPGRNVLLQRLWQFVIHPSFLEMTHQHFAILYHLNPNGSIKHLWEQLSRPSLDRVQRTTVGQNQLLSTVQVSRRCLKRRRTCPFSSGPRNCRHTLPTLSSDHNEYLRHALKRPHIHGRISHTTAGRSLCQRMRLRLM